MFDPEKLIKSLSESAVKFVIIGGVAARIHGGSIPTEDFDVCYERSRENLGAVVNALLKHNPRLRGLNLPKDLPRTACPYSNNDGVAGAGVRKNGGKNHGMGVHDRGGLLDPGILTAPVVGRTLSGHVRIDPLERTIAND